MKTVEEELNNITSTEVPLQDNELTYDARVKAETMVGRAVLDGHKITPYGSRVTHVWGAEADYDFLVCPTSYSFYPFIRELERIGFREDGSNLSDTMGVDSDWKSLSYYGKKGGDRVNFIVVKDPKRYAQLHAANILVAKNRIRNKDNRVALADHFTGENTLTPERLSEVLSDKVESFSSSSTF